MLRVAALVLLLLFPIARPIWSAVVPTAMGNPVSAAMPCGAEPDPGPVLFPEAPCCPLCTPETCPCLAAPALPQVPTPEPMTPPTSDHAQVLAELALRAVVAWLPAAPQAVGPRVQPMVSSPWAELDAQAIMGLRTT